MDNDYQCVLQRLREERDQQNLAQRLRVYCMGMQQDHYSKAETGHEHFSYQELAEVCASDADALYLLTGKKPENEEKSPHGL